MKNKFSIALSLAVILSMLLTSLALADDISNNLDPSVDAVAEVMPLTVGGANGNTQLYVVPTNEDGKNGCNLTGSTTLVVSVSSSDTAVATVSPSSVTFTSCGATPTLTVTPHSQGSATISLSQTSNSTDGTFNLAPATFTVNVTNPTPANTAPSVVVAGVTGGASYSKGSVPAATCEVTDAEDGNSSFPATLSAVTGPYASDGIGEQTASCSYTDGGGLTAVASETYNIIDPSAPVINYALDPASADGDNGWYVSDVSLTWDVSEPESPNSLEKIGCVDQNITADQQETTYSCAASSAGGSADQVDVSIKRDATAPSVSLVGGPANGASYYFGSVPAAPTCNASDATSGLAGACSVSGYGTTVGSHTVTASASDNAGNSANASATYTVLAWTLNGFYQPVDMDKVNTVKNGSTVPLKFEIFAGSTELTDTSFVNQPLKASQTLCDGGATDDIELLSSGSTVLRYDATAGQFIYNWQTPKGKAGYCYVVTVTTADGSSITANFKLK